MNIILNKLSKQKIIFAFFMFSILVKIFYVFFFSDTGTDKMYQLVTTKNAIEGKNISLYYYSVDNLSLQVEEKIYKWPHGYNYLILIINFIVNDVFLSSVILEIIFSILFLYIIFLTSKLLNVSNLIIILGLTFFTFNLSLYQYSGATELIGITFFYATIFICLKNINDTKLKTNDFISSILLMFPAFVKFSFYPIIFTIPISLLFFSFFKKDKIVFYKSLIYFIGSFLFIFIQSLLLKKYSGHSNLMDNIESGFYLNNLLKFDSFFLNSFFNSDYLVKYFNYIFKDKISSIIVLILNFLIVLTFLFFELLRFYRFIKNKSYNLDFMLNLFGLVLFAVNILYLIYLSISYNFPLDNYWTYVEESRYFIPIKIYFQIYFFFIILKYVKSKILNILVSIILLFNVIYFIKISSTSNIWTIKKTKDIKIEYLDYLQRKYDNFLFIDNKLNTIIWASLKNIKTIDRHSYKRLINNEYYSEDNINLIIEIFNEPSENENNFLKTNNAVLIKEELDSKFYIIKLNRKLNDN